MNEMDKKLDQQCKDALDLLNKGMAEDQFDTADLENLVVKFPACEKNIRETFYLWQHIDQLKVPPVPESARERFNTMLQEFEEEEQTIQFHAPSSQFSFLKWAAVFILGIGIGYMGSTFNSAVREGNEPTASSKILAALSVDNSAAMRLNALQQIKNNKDPKKHVYEALYTTIMNDPNVNVRLSAIDAMLNFSDQPKVRALLVRALANQDSPIVQLSLADVIISLEEEDSIEEIRKLLRSDKLDWEIKKHLEESLSQI